MKVLLPQGSRISPGHHMIETVRTEVVQTWFMGVLIDHQENEIHEDHAVFVPEPPVDENGEFSFADKTWTVIRDDSPLWDIEIEFRPTLQKSRLADGTEVMVLNSNPDFPGNQIRHICPGGKAGWIARQDHKHRIAMQQGVVNGWWELDETGTIPRRLPIKVSIAEMALQNKTLMAHLMVDLELFPSVGQAKKNGWDKPLQLGRHELGPKKKRVTVEIVP